MNESDLTPINIQDVEGKIVSLRGMKVMADADVAFLYGVETKRINEAVRNNPDKFPESYMFLLTPDEFYDLRTKISTTNVSTKTRSVTKVFTEKGLYMLATILKSKRAKDVTFAIIETFAKVQELKKEIVALHQETDKQAQATRMQHFGELLTDIVMPDLQTQETESSLEINFLVGKVKHTVRRVKKEK